MKKFLLVLSFFCIIRGFGSDECYLPKYADLECNTGVNTYADLLYWFAKEDNISPCMTVVGVSSPIAGSESVYGGVNVTHLPPKWDPGLRVGIGYNFQRDGWDIDLNYLWYHNRRGETFSTPLFGSAAAPFFPSPDQLALVDPWINPVIVNLSAPAFDNPAFDSVQALWTLTLNKIDLDFGRKFHISEYMATRSYIGIRGIWFKTRFYNIATSNAIFSDTYTNNTFSDKFKDHIWGLGLLGGVEPEWHITDNFILFTNLDAALLWGKIKIHKEEDYTSFNPSGVRTIDFHNILLSNALKLLTEVDITAGFRWEETWGYSLRTCLDLGWEYHIRLDINNRVKYGSMFGYSAGSGNDFGFYGYQELQGSLMLSGFYFRLKAVF